MDDQKIIMGFDDHLEVSRTVSDTLAAEYNDYITTKRATPATHIYHHCGLLSSDHTKECKNDELSVEDVNYNSKVEFGLKLGYTESQVQMALVKVGPSASQNELLEELIKLGASMTNLTKCPQDKEDDHNSDSDNLRPIVIDGSNVAMSHGNKEVFSCTGIKICAEWFKSRGHKEITVFVPMYRKEAYSYDAPIKDREVLLQLENERLLVFTPSRMVGGRKVVCHDDRYVLKLASENDGIVVSNDNYRSLVNENPEFKVVVEERLLMYSFVKDRFMPPDDPLGKHGPSLDNFLRKKPKLPDTHCPYGKKCTYGNKCKYYHPERGNQPQKSITERLVEQAKLQLLEVKARKSCSLDKGREALPGEKNKVTHSESYPPTASEAAKKKPLQRTKSGIVHSSNDNKKEIKDNKDVEVGNLHRKLKRQLTLNPNYDPRLLHMAGYIKNDSDNSSTSSSTNNIKCGSHKQLTRIHSDNLKINQFHPNLNAHSNVTRIASAPNGGDCGRYQSGIVKINSRSDSKLHVNQLFNTIRASSPFPSTIWSNEEISFNRAWPQSNTIRLSSFPPAKANATSCPLLAPSSVPFTTSIHRSLSPELFTDNPRSKLYFHLSQIFPEKQVRAAMDLYPGETNAQCICAAILMMFPKS